MPRYIAIRSFAETMTSDAKGGNHDQDRKFETSNFFALVKVDRHNNREGAMPQGTAFS